MKRDTGDYASTLDAFRKRMRSGERTQGRRSRKSSQSHFEDAGSEKAPLRLPLGKIAVATISSKLDHVKADLETWRSLSESVGYDQ